MLRARFALAAALAGVSLITFGNAGFSATSVGIAGAPGLFSPASGAPAGAAGASDASLAARRARADTRQTAIQRFSAFGFDVGEERHYVLGPPEALAPEESATWLIRLDRIRDNGEAVFALAHERHGPQYTNGTPAYGEEILAQMDGELTVNAHGFPLSLSFKVLRQFYGALDENYHVHYRFDGRSYLKEVQTEGKRWEIAVPIPGHKNLDKSVPIGLYLFLPDAFECIGYHPSILRTMPIVPQKPTVGRGLTNVQPPTTYRLAVECESDADLAFLNPGLLTLTWPVLLEEGDGDRDYLFFTPPGPDLFPGGQVNVGFVGGGVAGSAGRGRGSNIDRARNPRRYATSSRIRLLEPTTITMRGRTLDVTPAKVDRVPGPVYFDEGKVVRVDIDPSLFTMVEGYGGLGANFDRDAMEHRWVRLLFPSEY